MEGHTRLLWLTCGGLAVTGVVAPLAMAHTLENASLIQALRAMGGVGFVAGVIVMLRFIGSNAPVGDVIYETPPPAPRTLDSNPLATAAETTPLERRIDAAAEASTRFARTIGVIYYNLDSYRQIARSCGLARAEAAMDEIRDRLQASLRNTDRVERLHKGRFAVCIVLLPDKPALLSIRDRLNAAMQSMRIDDLRGASVAFDDGMSIYPIGGYTGEDLIANAQRRCDAAHAQRLRAEARKRKAMTERHVA